MPFLFVLNMLYLILVKDNVNLYILFGKSVFLLNDSSVKYKIKSVRRYNMGKEVKYEFDYMRINDVMSHVIVYEDGSVEYTDFTDIESFSAISP